MIVKPISKLIIINNTHYENISQFGNITSLLKKLEVERFIVNISVENPKIEIYQSDLFVDINKQTHLIINSDNLILEINYYSLN